MAILDEKRDETIGLVKECYSYIAGLQQKDNLVVVMKDNAGENK
jgi:hypothetical protein